MRHKKLGHLLACAAAVMLFATVARAFEGTVYRLDTGSTRQEGCLPPCLCPIQIAADVVGTFELLDNPTTDRCVQAFKVKRVNWVYSSGGVDVRVTGEGEYEIRQCGPVRSQHRLVLELSENGAHPRRFDSGLVAGGGSFPTIDIAIAVNGFFCYDTVYDITASPVPEEELVPYFLHHTEYLEGCFEPCRCLLRDWAAVGGFVLVDINTAPNPPRKRYAVLDFHAETVGPIDPPDRSFDGLGIYSAGQRDHRLVLDLTEPTIGSLTMDSGHVAYDGAWPEINIDISDNGFYCFNHAFYLHARPR